MICSAAALAWKEVADRHRVGSRDRDEDQVLHARCLRCVCEVLCRGVVTFRTSGQVQDDLDTVECLGQPFSCDGVGLNVGDAGSVLAGMPRQDSHLRSGCS